VKIKKYATIDFHANPEPSHKRADDALGTGREKRKKLEGVQN